MLGDHWQKAFLFAFVDAGQASILKRLRSEDPNLSQLAHTDLLSWGVGLRLAGLGGFDAALDWAMPRADTLNTSAGDSRLHFGFSYAY
jgi:hemolysin activation/secretion protein